MTHKPCIWKVCPSIPLALTIAKKYPGYIHTSIYDFEHTPHERDTEWISSYINYTAKSENMKIIIHPTIWKMYNTGILKLFYRV